MKKVTDGCGKTSMDTRRELAGKLGLGARGRRGRRGMEGGGGERWKKDG